MLRELKNEGFASIVEVIVTSVVFVIAAFGVLSTITMFKPHSEESSRTMEAAYIGKGIIDDLRQQVSAEDWNVPGSVLWPDTYSTTIVTDPGGINYTIDYVITDVGLARRLTMTITWPDL